ncbi:MAG: hypothetical protein AAF573_07555 [Bacteroidota bacterium]
MIPLKQFGEEIFSAAEITVLKNVLKNAGYKSRNEIVEIAKSAGKI